MNKDHKTTLIDKCVVTGVYYSVTAKTEDWRRYENGEGRVRDIFHYLTIEDQAFIETRESPLGWNSSISCR